MTATCQLYPLLLSACSCHSTRLFGRAVGSDPCGGARLQGGLCSSASSVSWVGGETGGIANGIPHSLSGVMFILKHRDRVVVSPTNTKPALNLLGYG